MRFVFALVVFFTTQLAIAAVPINGWYSTLFGGYTYLPGNVNKTYNLNNTPITVSHASYQAGFDAGGSFGYKSAPMRYEGEFTYLRANINRFNVNQIPQTNNRGHSYDFFVMANVYYDFPNWLNCIQPYLGGGIGYGWLYSNFQGTDSQFGTVVFNRSNTEFSYQGMAGLIYNFSENYALTLGYRYIATLTASQFGTYFQANLANVGAVYRFDESRYK